jgi:hypothetical protein
MNIVVQQIVTEVENLPLPLQEEALDFVRFLNTKLVKEETKPHEPNGRKVVEVLREIAASGSVFQEIEDPVAWQREIRQDRPLVGREDFRNVLNIL